jgi:hypothetical protein
MKIALFSISLALSIAMNLWTFASPAHATDQKSFCNLDRASVTQSTQDRAMEDPAEIQLAQSVPPTGNCVYWQGNCIRACQTPGTTCRFVLRSNPPRCSCDP